jgi:hypothetical protein
MIQVHSTVSTMDSPKKRVHWDAELEALWDAEMECLSTELAEKRWTREMELRRARAIEKNAPKKEEKEEEEPLWSLSSAMEIGLSILDLMEKRTDLMEEIASMEETLKKE